MTTESNEEQAAWDEYERVCSAAWDKYKHARDSTEGDERACGDPGCTSLFHCKGAGRECAEDAVGIKYERAKANYNRVRVEYESARDVFEHAQLVCERAKDAWQIRCVEFASADAEFKRVREYYNLVTMEYERARKMAGEDP